jgi:hypothetical protein
MEIYYKMLAEVVTVRDENQRHVHLAGCHVAHGGRFGGQLLDGAGGL